MFEMQTIINMCTANLKIKEGETHVKSRVTLFDTPLTSLH